jgi:hypothetical protein
MAGYIGTKAAVVTPGAERKKVFSITTTTTSLTGLAYTPGFVHVFHNGVRLVDGTDYTATNGTSLTLTTAAQNGDEVVVISYATFEVADAYTKAESDDRYVNVTGDTMTGALAVNGNLTVDTNTLFVDAASNNVGIGTSSPAARLGIPSPLYSSSFTGGMIRFQNPDVAADSCIQSYHVTGAGSDVFIGANSYVNLSGATVRFSDSYAASYINVRRDGDIDFSTNTSAGNPTMRLRIDSAGRVTMPYQPMAYVEYGGPTVSAGATLDLSGGTAGLNVGNMYNSANGRYTVPVSGVYRLTMGSQGKTIANTNAGSLYYRINGGGLVGQTLFYGEAFSGNQSEFLLSLVANDYVQVATFGNNSVTYTHNGVRATFELVG